MASVTLVCCHARQPEYLARLIRVHEAYAWVSSIVALDTSADFHFYREGKVLHGGIDCGFGFHRQPEAGGFDEIRARETAMRIARGEAGYWKLICDADELYHPDLVQVLDKAEQSAMPMLGVECWPVVSPTQYRYTPETVYDVDGMRLHDPHVRAFNCFQVVEYDLAPKAWSYSNRTQHCRPKVAHNKRRYVPGFFHLHVKRTWNYSPEQLRTLPEPLPPTWFD